jgi:hypothetical protein
LRDAAAQGFPLGSHSEVVFEPDGDLSHRDTLPRVPG